MSNPYDPAEWNRIETNTMWLVNGPEIERDNWRKDYKAQKRTADRALKTAWRIVGWKDGDEWRFGEWKWF